MSFDTLAPYYRSMELLSAGGVMQSSRTAFLAEAVGCRRALLLGEGPGRFLVELLRTNRGVEVTCVESSPRMIQQALRACNRAGLATARVRFERCDALMWQPPLGAFDLVVTHFFLDCFRRHELEGLVSKIAASATVGARWLLADFCVPKNGWKKWRARMVIALMYAFFRFTTGLSATQIASAEDLLQAAGFQLEARRLANFGLIHSDLWLRGKD